MLEKSSYTHLFFSDFSLDFVSYSEILHSLTSG